MGKRKKNKSENQQSGAVKRPRIEGGGDGGDGIFGAARGYIDQSTGQRGAFPGLDPNEGDFYGPANDGLGYLRMVRSEARGVPSLLLGAHAAASVPPPPKQRLPIPATSADDIMLDYDDEGGAAESEEITEVLEDEKDLDVFFDESTVISLYRTPARPPLPPHHHSLISHFASTRQRLHSTPQPSTTGNVEPLPHKFAPKWMYDHVPTPRLLWALDQTRALRCIEVVTKCVGKGTRTLRRGVDKRIAEWIWGLLIRVDNVMSSEDAAIVRDLGKSALKVAKALRQVDHLEWEVAQPGDEGRALPSDQTMSGTEIHVISDSGPSEKPGLGNESINSTRLADGSGCEEKGLTDQHNGASLGGDAEKVANARNSPEPEDGEVAAAKPVRDCKPESQDRLSSLGTLDMIVSITGDYFGQRDLLDEHYAS